MEEIKTVSTEINTFLEKALRCTSENKSKKELITLLNTGADILIHLNLKGLIPIKQQGIEHLNRLIDLKNEKSRFWVSIISGIIGALIGGMLAYFSAIKAIDDQRHYSVESKLRSVIALEVANLDPLNLISKERNFKMLSDSIQRIRAAMIEYSFYIDDHEAFDSDIRNIMDYHSSLLAEDTAKTLKQDKFPIALDEYINIYSEFYNKVMQIGRKNYK